MNCSEFRQVFPNANNIAYNARLSASEIKKEIIWHSMHLIKNGYTFNSVEALFGD